MDKGHNRAPSSALQLTRGEGVWGGEDVSGAISMYGTVPLN